MSIQNREGLLQGEEDKTCYFIDGEKPPQKKPSDLMPLVGESGRYQIRLTIIFAVFWTFTAWGTMLPAYIFKTPEFLCNGVTCLETVACKSSNFKIDPNQQQTVSTAFNLYCDRKSLRSLGQSLVYVGALIGMVCLSAVADNKGRKIAQMIGYSCCSIGFIGLGLSPNLPMAFIFSTLFGAAIFSTLIIDLVMISEQMGTKMRQQVSVGIMLFNSINEISLAFAAKYIINWRYLCIFFLGIPALFAVFLNYFVKESPKFLALKNKEKAFKILNEIAEINGKDKIEKDEFDRIMSTHAGETSDENRRIYTFLDLFRFLSLRIVTICCFIIFFAAQVLFYGSEFALEDIGYGLYTNGAIIGAADTFGYLLAFFCIPTFKRKKSTFWSQLMTAILGLCFIFFNLPENCLGSRDSCAMKTVQITFAAFIRVVNSFVYSFLFVYFAELYPTSIKSLGMGAIKVMGIIGVILCPFLIEMCKNFGFNPIILLGAITLFGAIASIFLPETLGDRMHDEIEELRRNSMFASRIPNFARKKSKKSKFIESKAVL